VTTPEPGESEVLTEGWIFNPFSTAFFATNPAAIIASGLEVLVHEVIAAKTTDPCLKVCYFPSMVNLCYILALLGSTPKPLNPTLLGTQSVKSFFICFNATLSCGLFGPDKQGYTVERSNSKTSVNLILSLAL